MNSLLKLSDMEFASTPNYQPPFKRCRHKMLLRFAHFMTTLLEQYFLNRCFPVLFP